MFYTVLYIYKKALIHQCYFGTHFQKSKDNNEYCFYSVLLI